MAIKFGPSKQLLAALTLTLSAFAAAQSPVVPDSTGYGFTHGQWVISNNGAISAASSRAEMTHTHAGLDIQAPRGSEIRAFAAGSVVKVIDKATSCAKTLIPTPEWCYLGYMVLLEHRSTSGPTFYTMYLHMNETPSVKVGASVPAGYKIGTVGSTGAATGPHTHFEIRYFKNTLYPAWGNIYGRGDWTGSESFKRDWLDPQVAFRRNVPATPAQGGPDRTRDTYSNGLNVGPIIMLTMVIAGFLFIVGARKLGMKVLGLAIVAAVISTFV